MRNLEKRLQKLYIFIKDADRVNSSVSSANVGWHIEHSLLVIIKMISALTASDPAQYKWKFNLARAIVFTINKFPRGKGKAPDAVNPKQIEKTDFDALFTKTREKIEELKKKNNNKEKKELSTRDWLIIVGVIFFIILTLGLFFWQKEKGKEQKFQCFHNLKNNWKVKLLKINRFFF